MGLLPTMKTRALLLLLLVSLLMLAATSAQRQRSRSRSRSRSRGWNQCDRIPGFRISDNGEPVRIPSGDVTLVALLTSTCSFCISQSESLQILYNQLQENETGIQMMIINAGPRPQPGRPGVFEQRVSFPVYHDDNRRTIWRRVFRGNKDDIFLFDRCGQMTYRIPMPYSYLGYSYVRTGIRRTYNGNTPCNCQSDDLYNRMMGDAPALGSVGRNPQTWSRMRDVGGIRYHSSPRMRDIGRSRYHSSYRNRNRSQCPRSDSLCSEMRRARRRLNRYAKQHGLTIPSARNEREYLELFDRAQRPRSGFGPAL